MIFLEKPKQFNSKFEVVSCFFKKDNEFLLLRRQDSKPQGDTWGVPAGKVEDGESLTKAICREIEEETGYEFTENLPKLTNTIFVKYLDYDFIYHIFELDVDNDIEVRIDLSSHKEFKWANKEESLKMNLIQDLDACIDLYFK
jgi:8-oxo-dGTP pyrophosphatase MutT (NUDIX family)